MEGRPLITRVVLENYKSIPFCDVKLGPLAILIGPNGSGKSNFLDALHFLSEAVTGTILTAIQNRGGYGHVLRRGHVNHLGLRIEFATVGGSQGYYSIRLKRDVDTKFTIEREKCVINGAHNFAEYENEKGKLKSSIETPAGLTRDFLYLPVMSGYPQFKPVYELLNQLQFYNLHPREFVQPANDEDASWPLQCNAKNLANVLNRIRVLNQVRGAMSGFDRVDRINQYLQEINPSVMKVTTQAFGGFRSMKFSLRGDDDAFDAIQMSDGTLRSLAVLVALFQGVGGDPAISLIGLEEPEAALHPAAAGVLFDAMREASASVQVVATTHSADLLDKKEIETDSIIAVELQDGATRIGHVDQTGREALKKQLYTAGELMRMNYLRPETPRMPDESEIEALLFGDPVTA